MIMGKNNKIYQLALLLFLFLLFYSCDDDINRQKECNLKTTFIDSTNIIHFDDEFLINFSLQGQKYPQGFYNEELNNIASIYYVNTVSTKLDITKWIQLCTDDSSEAISWIKLSSENEITEFTETEKYFEAKSNSTTSSFKILFRVNKCSYLDRTNYNFLNKSDTLGIFNKRPINEQSVKEVIEYLWFLRNYQTANTDVLFTKLTVNNADIICNIFSTHYSEGDWGMCPTVQVYDEVYKITKSDGIIIYKKDLVRIISD